jgi:thiamine-monophosphate kinase
MTKKKSEELSIKSLGEFGLIKHLTNNFDIFNRETLKGIGDDAAVITGNDKRILVTTDMLTEGIHFNLIYTPLKHLGYKAAVVNFSDIYAMNGHPKQLFVSIAISSKIGLKAVEELYEGIKLACDKYRVDLAGGDTTTSLTGMTICMTATGVAEENNITYRDNANINDLICVSGFLGGAYLGLLILERERIVFETSSKAEIKLDNYSGVIQRQLKPEARKDVIELLSELKIKPTAMIDISDGLSSELFHICEKSDCGCKIFHDKIPISPDTIKVAKELDIDPLVAALNGGEDYELLFTISQNDYEKIKNIQGISVIGYICEKQNGKTLIGTDGVQVPLIASGWNAFSNENH